MIYDCFQFFNELDLLKLRLNTLNDVVDYFVITESTVTFSGESKSLYYYENKHKFSEFNHKIIHNVVSDTPMGQDITGFDRDGYQKAARSRGIANCLPADIIIFSDLDEIPNPIEIKKIISNFDPDKIYHFAQRQFYYYVNLEEVSGKLLSYAGEYDSAKPKKWLGSYLFSYGLTSKMSMHEIRINKTIKNSIRVSNGGWHFTYMGGDSKSVTERVAHKIKSSSHQEFNNHKILSKIESRIKKGKDIFGRKSKLRRVNIDSSFPKYLVENIDQYSHLILPPAKPSVLVRLKLLFLSSAH